MKERTYAQHEHFDVVLGNHHVRDVEDEAGRTVGQAQTMIRDDGKLVIRIPAKMVQKEQS